MHYSNAYEFDSYCPSCVAGYYFQIGPGLSQCRSCGSNFNKDTDGGSTHNEEIIASNFLDFAMSTGPVNTLKDLEVDLPLGKKLMLSELDDRIETLQALWEKLLNAGD